MKSFITTVFFLMLAFLVSNNANAQTTATSSVDLACVNLNLNLCPDAPNSYCPKELYKAGPTNDNKDFIFKDWKPVSALQKFLKSAGYLPKSTVINGNYGPQTTFAVAKFQKDYKLTTDQSGFTGPQTRNFIRKLSCGKDALDKTLPDLVAVNGIVVATTTNPLEISAEINIKNIGHGLASSTAVHEFTATGNGTVTLVSSTCSQADLPADASCKVSYKILFANDGEKELVFKVDKKNKVREINENNNTAKLKYDLGKSSSNSGSGSGVGGEPTVDITANPMSVTSVNSTSTISWTSSNVKSCKVVGNNGISNWTKNSELATSSTGVLVSGFIKEDTSFRIECVGSIDKKVSDAVTVKRTGTGDTGTGATNRYIRDIDLNSNDKGTFTRYSSDGSLSSNTLSVRWDTNIGGDKPVTITLVNTSDNTTYKFGADTYTKDSSGKYYASFTNKMLKDKGLTYGIYKVKISIVRGDGIKQEETSTKTIEVVAGNVTTQSKIENIVVRNETAGKDVTTLNIAPYLLSGVSTERQYHISWTPTAFTDENARIFLKGADGYTKEPFSGQTIKASSGRFDFSGRALRVTAAVTEGSYKLTVQSSKNGQTVTAEKDIEIVKN